MYDLNRSTAVPFAFRVYATYEVDSNLSDKKLHSILDKLNPDLRSIEDINGKKRVREFYAMSPEDAYSILEAIAEISNYSDRLKLWTASADEQAEEAVAEEINEAHQERLKPFSFSMCDIPVGAKLVFCPSVDTESSIECVVADDKKVIYAGRTWSLSALASELLHTKWAVAGPRYFKYNGEWLNDIRKRLGFWRTDTSSD